jgi:hypothetical protein
MIIQKDIEARMIFNGIDVTLGSNELVFPEYNARINLNEGKNEIGVVPDADFSFQSSDGSLFGYVKVVDDINKIDIDKIKAEIENFTPPPILSGRGGAGGAGCH